MYKLSILEDAKLDLKESSAWYDKQKANLGKQFLKEVFITFDKIKKSPTSYPVRFSQKFRFAQVKIFPFFVVFEIIGQTILVNAVFHQSKDPKQL